MGFILGRGQRKETLRRKYNSVTLDSIPWRDRWTLYACFPRHALRIAHMRFRLACPLPGDHFCAFQRDVYATFTGVDRGEAVLEVRRGRVHHGLLNGDWGAPLPAGVERSYERVPMSEFRRQGWMPERR